MGSENFTGSKGMSIFMVIETLPTCFPNEPYLFELPPLIFVPFRASTQALALVQCLVVMSPFR